ncbi:MULTISPECIES: hypothetical protein [Bradyrhizobium]|uniref:hypothetical protein n=1 Tax=Bradyrhizobium elkanii TaxID=29448 RepID=UPI00040545D9|nr:hypothetical protein [Bradyrhizobium elkanii]
MRRVIAIAVAGASLAGCSSFSWDSFKSAPAPVQVQLESTPPGADAVTSVGPGCKTPCTVSVAAPDSGFSVTFNLPKYESATVPVTVVRNPGDLTTAASTVVDPNPVVAELKPTAPPLKARKPRPKRPKPAAAAAAPAAEPATAAGTPFPDPNAPVQR